MGFCVLLSVSTVGTRRKAATPGELPHQLFSGIDVVFVTLEAFFQFRTQDMDARD